MKKTLLAAAAAALLLLGGSTKARASYDGTPSTASITIVSNASLAAATASGSLTVVDNTSLLNTIVTIGAVQIKAGRDYQVGGSVNASATNLAAAINSLSPLVTAQANSATVNLTAVDLGTLYNSVGLATSNSGEVSVSGAHLTGGLDQAVVTINAIPLVQGRDWFVADVASNTAIALANAINVHPRLSRQVNAQPISTSVYLRSVFSPVSYTLAAAPSAGVTVSQAAMTGGTPGILTFSGCFLGSFAALPNANVAAGCLLYLTTDPTHLQLSTQTVTGAANANATNSYIAK